MKRNILLWICAALTLVVGMSSCNSDQDYEIEQLAQWTETELDSINFSEMRQNVYDSWIEEDCDGWKITRNGRGQVTKVIFENNSKRQPPKNAEEFFDMFFDKNVAKHFKQDRPFNEANNINELWIEYAGKFEVSYYSFLYENGIMTWAGGEYIPLDNFNTKPRISEKEAIYISCHGQIPDENRVKLSAVLGVTLFPEGGVFVPRLLYDIHFRPTLGGYGCYPGVTVDAHTGKVVWKGVINI